MRKLRTTTEERRDILKDIRDMLAKSGKANIDDFSIEDIIKTHSALPDNIPKPIISVTNIAWLKMLELVKQSPVECSWHGLVKRIKPYEYLLYDVLVFPQINTATTTTGEDEGFAEWQLKLIMDPDFPIEDLRMHGHSHVNMNVFSSGTDDTYQKDILTKVENGDYYIFFIMNKKLEIFIRLYDFEHQILFETDDIELLIGRDNKEQTAINKWAEKELKEKTSKPVQTFSRKLKNKTYKYTLDDDEEEVSYYNTAFPLFKGVKNGSK